MSLYSRLSDVAKSIMGVSVYADRRPFGGPQLDAEAVIATREALGGIIQPLPVSQTRWMMADLEAAQKSADGGDLSIVGRLRRSMRRDGVIAGLLDTRTSGMLALPKQWRGDPAQVAELTTENGTRAFWDEMAPPSELAAWVGDAIVCGVGIGELVPVVGRDHPRFVRLEPEFLRWRQAEGRWYYTTVAGAVPVTPGDGRWVLLVEGGYQNPWQNGCWHALGRAYILKEHAMLARNNYSRTLAQPARYAKAPVGAEETERTGFLAGLMRWAFNTTFELPPGWDVGLLESNGRGWEVYDKEIETSNFETMIALCGQIVTVTGGSGFANADIHRTIRADLIKKSADAAALAANQQIIAPWVMKTRGEAALANMARFALDVKPPEDRKVEAEALKAVAEAASALVEVFTAQGIKIDLNEIAARFGVPVEMLAQATSSAPGTTLAGNGS